MKQVLVYFLIPRLVNVGRRNIRHKAPQEMMSNVREVLRFKEIVFTFHNLIDCL
jgi:hypothetical protein